MLPKYFFPAFFICASLTAKSQNGTPYWSLSGNNNGATSSRLGTTNSTPLNLSTNNLPRIYIAPDGKVGIGTTTPTSLFNVEGPTLLSIFTSTDALGAGSGSGVIGYTKFQPTAAGQRLGYFLTGSQNGGTDAGNSTGMVGYADGAWSSTSRPAYLTFETAKSGSKLRSEAMRISSGGYVGIGTKMPTHRLHVVDSAGVAVYAQGVGSNTYGVYASGGQYGVAGTGGDFGIYGNGTKYGVYATGGSYGVFGTGTSYGLYGSSSAFGVYGTGEVGVSGESSSSNGKAVRGLASGYSGYGGDFESSAGIGLYASTGNSGSFAGYFKGNVYTSGTYTGSDKKLKKNISDFTQAVSIIKKLKPKSYEFQTEGKMAEMNLPKGKHYGLIAQDLETVLPNLVIETPQFPGNDSISGTKINGNLAADQQTFKAVNYTELIPILIKSVQEEDEDKEELKQKLLEQDAKLQTLEAKLDKLTAMLEKTGSGFLSSASLEVPVPNPAKGTTNIQYNIPVGTASARLTIVNMLGQVMKEVKLTSGRGEINFNVSNLASGVYPCTLWVNGQQMASKQLLISH